MRLAHFRLERYGPFEHLELPLDPTPGRVNLIVAPNGYGKSVIRQAIGEFLFGIEARTPMTFRFGSERMRLLADVVHDGTHAPGPAQGQRHHPGRRERHRGAPAQRSRVCSAAPTRRCFASCSASTPPCCAPAADDLIRSQGRLGQVLFAAGGGMARVRDLLTELERKRDELGEATARHKSRPIWSAFSAWEQAGTDLRRLALRPDGWQTLERQAAGRRRNLEHPARRTGRRGQERDRLRTIGACRPWLERLHFAHSVLAEAQDAPELDDGFEKRWRDALEDGVRVSQRRHAAETALQLAPQARATLTFDPAWIAAEADITALAELRGVALAGRSRPAEAWSANGTRNRPGRRRCGASLATWARLALPPAAVVKDAQRRLQQHPKLALEAAAAQDRLAQADPRPCGHAGGTGRPARVGRHRGGRRSGGAAARRGRPGRPVARRPAQAAGCRVRPARGACRHPGQSAVGSRPDRHRRAV